MLAVVIGKCKMREWILVYTLPLVMASLLPWIPGFVRPICATVAIATSARLTS